MPSSHPSSVCGSTLSRRKAQLVISSLVASIVLGVSGCAQPSASQNPFACAVSLIEAKQIEDIDSNLAIRHGLDGVRDAVGADVYIEAIQEAQLRNDEMSMVEFEVLLCQLARSTDYSQDDLMEIAMRSLMEKLEYHSVYVSPKQVAEFEEIVTKNNAMIGVEIEKSQGWPIVVDVYSGGPAETAGLEPGDRIVKINGQSTEGAGLVQTIEKLLGSENSKVSVTVVPFGKELPETVVVTRVRSSSLRIEPQLLNEHVGYIQMFRLNEQSSKELAAVLARFRGESQLKAILLDLRGNKGGSLAVARDVTDQFIREGLICWIQQGNGQLPHSWFAKDQGNEPCLPLVVFADQKTTSGGEMIASALRAHATAILVGQETGGKGMVDGVFPLSNGGRIRIPIAWLGVKDGERLEGHGILPDISMECDSGQINAIAEAIARLDSLSPPEMLSRIRESISATAKN